MQLSDIRAKLGYEKVTEHFHSGNQGFWIFKSKYHRKEFRIKSDLDDSQYISLLFEGANGEDGFLHLAFHDWHCHFDDHEDDEMNLHEAIDVARQLIEGRLALRITRDSSGRYTGGNLVSVEQELADLDLQNIVFFDHKNAAKVRVNVTRDSVCMGDDVDAPHLKSYSFPCFNAIGPVLAFVIREYPLAGVAGGDTVWVLRAEKPLAVMALSKREFKVLVEKGEPIASISKSDGVLNLHFEYRPNGTLSEAYEDLRGNLS